MTVGLTQVRRVERQENYLGLREILTVVFKYKLVILFVFMSITLSSLVLPYFMTPIYEADSSLLVKMGREHMFSSEVDDAAPQMTVDLKTLVDPELAILTSRDLMQRVVETLGPHAMYDLEDASSTMSSLEASILKFGENLDAYQQGESNVIIVTFQHENPHIAAKAVNLLGDFWKELHLKIFSTPQTPFLDEQAEKYRVRLQRSETNLQVFKQDHGIASFVEQEKLYWIQRQELDSNLKSVNNEVQSFTTKISSLSQQMKGLPKEIPLSTVNEQRRMIDETKRELLDLRRKEQEFSGRYQDTSRALIDLRKEIDLIQAFIQEQENLIGDTVTSGRNPVYQQLELELLSAKSQHAALNTQERVVSKQIQDLDAQISNLGQLKKEFNGLEREVNNDQENLSRYLDKAEAARISQEMDKQQIANVSVIQAATIPAEPLSPKKGRIAILGVILGALSSISLAFLLETLRSNYTRPEQVSRDLGLPILVSISDKE